jgi:histone H3/H4
MWPFKTKPVIPQYQLDLLNPGYKALVQDEIRITSEALDFENSFISKLRDSMLDVAVEVADLRGTKTIDAADLKHVLRHAFERALRKI